MYQIIDNIIYIIILSTLLISVVAWMNEEMRNTWIGHPYSTYFHGEWYRLLTAGLVHIDLLHLFFNLYVFYSFSRLVGRCLELTCGQWSGALFVLLYVGAILSASLVLLFQHRRDPYYYHIGASAGVTAMMTVAIVYFPYLPIGFFFLPIDIPGIVFLTLYLLWNFLARNSATGRESLSNFIGGIYGIVFVACLRWREVITFLHTSWQQHW
ncbi:MAG: rhomboid family intramembrane serine protease [Bacteroidota bacterium]